MVLDTDERLLRNNVQDSVARFRGGVDLADGLSYHFDVSGVKRFLQRLLCRYIAQLLQHKPRNAAPTLKGTVRTSVSGRSGSLAYSRVWQASMSSQLHTGM